jgi:hypothetical protein
MAVSGAYPGTWSLNSRRWQPSRKRFYDHSRYDFITQMQDERAVEAARHESLDPWASSTHDPTETLADERQTRRRSSALRRLTMQNGAI